MSRIMTISTAALAVLLVAGPALAQGGGQWGGHGGPLGMLGRYDTDKDGKISLAEYEAGRDQLFQRLANGKDAISFADIDAMEKQMDGMGNGRGGERMKARMEALKAADTNGDQSISADEFKAASDAEFKKLDTNGDGFIDASEAAAAMKPAG